MENLRHETVEMSAIVRAPLKLLRERLDPWDAESTGKLLPQLHQITNTIAAFQTQGYEGIGNPIIAPNDCCSAHCWTFSISTPSFPSPSHIIPVPPLHHFHHHPSISFHHHPSIISITTPPYHSITIPPSFPSPFHHIILLPPPHHFHHHSSISSHSQYHPSIISYSF